MRTPPILGPCVLTYVFFIAYARLCRCVARTPVDCNAGSVEDEWETTFAGVDKKRRPHAVFRIDIARLDSAFTGSGDLTAALLLAHSQVSLCL